jgi:hypothetical protein
MWFPWGLYYGRPMTGGQAMSEGWQPSNQLRNTPCVNRPNFSSKGTDPSQPPDVN